MERGNLGESCDLAGPRGKQLSQAQGWSPAQTWPEQLEDRALDEVLVLCCSTRSVQDWELQEDGEQVPDAVAG